MIYVLLPQHLYTHDNNTFNILNETEALLWEYGLNING